MELSIQTRCWPWAIKSLRNSRMRRLDQAEELAVPVFEKRRKVLGPEHPDTLSSMDRLAKHILYRSDWTMQKRWQCNRFTRIEKF